MEETIKVATDQFEGGFKIINKSDFDPDTMTVFVEPSTEVDTKVIKGAKAEKK